MLAVRSFWIIASVGTALLIAAPNLGLGQSPEAERLTRGTWLAARIFERTDVDQPTISFEPGSTLHGSAGCNRFRGTYSLEGRKLNIGNLSTTKMLCEPEIINQEQSYLAALNATREISFDGTNLTFLNSGGVEVVRFILSP